MRQSALLYDLVQLFRGKTRFFHGLAHGQLFAESVAVAHATHVAGNTALRIIRAHAFAEASTKHVVLHRDHEHAARGKLKSVNNQPTIEATTAEIAKTLGIEL